MLKKIMEQLHQEVGKDKENALVSENGSYLLLLEDEMDVEIKEFKESILLKSKIGLSPQKNEESFLLKALEANLFGIGTKNAVIGLEENLLTLSRELDYNISYEDFKAKLEEFINILYHWRLEALKT